MPITRWLFNNGEDGAAVSSANTDTTLVNTSGGTVTFSVADGLHGTTGIRLNSTQAANSCVVRWQLPVPSNYLRETVVVRTPLSAPATNVVLFTARHASGRILSIIWSSSNTLAISDSVNTIRVVAAAGVLSLNTKYRIAIVATGVSTTAGDIVVNVYAAEGSTVLATLHVTNANFTTNQFWGGDLGSGGVVYNIGIEDLQVSGDSGPEIPAYVPASAGLTANAGVHQLVTPNSTVQLNGSNSVNNTTFSWSFLWPSSGAPALTGATSATPSFVAGTAGMIYALQLQVGDGSQTSTATVNIAVSDTTLKTVERVWTGSAWS